jgi:hypothetical protein
MLNRRRIAVGPKSSWLDTTAADCCIHDPETRRFLLAQKLTGLENQQVLDAILLFYSGSSCRPLIVVVLVVPFSLFGT